MNVTSDLQGLVAFVTPGPQRTLVICDTRVSKDSQLETRGCQRTCEHLTLEAVTNFVVNFVERRSAASSSMSNILYAGGSCRSSPTFSILASGQVVRKQIMCICCCHISPPAAHSAHVYCRSWCGGGWHQLGHFLLLPRLPTALLTCDILYCISPVGIGSMQDGLPILLDNNVYVIVIYGKS